MTNDAFGNPATVVPDGQNDPHWTINSTPTTNTAAPAVVIDETAYPFSVYQADSSTSKWISVQADESSIYEPVGDYTYTTTFDLTGFDPATAGITGTYLDDDALISMTLNSTDAGVSDLSTNVTGGQSFSITQGFVAGVNTLTVVVMNDDIPASVNPTGLNIQMTGTATAVPEPTSLCLLAIGAGYAMGRRNRLATRGAR